MDPRPPNPLRRFSPAPVTVQAPDYDDEPPTSPDATANTTAWGRLVSVFADLDQRDSKAACDLLIAWWKSSPDRRVLLSALAREFRDK